MIRQYTLTLIRKFQAQKDNFTFEFINPDLEPAKARTFNIERDGEMIIQYHGSHKKLSRIGEENLMNTLISMSQVEKQ